MHASIREEECASPRACEVRASCGDSHAGVVRPGARARSAAKTGRPGERKPGRPDESGGYVGFEKGADAIADRRRGVCDHAGGHRAIGATNIPRVLGAQTEKGAIPLITRFSPHDGRDPAASLRVLLAEDNAVNQRLAVRLLEKRGHHVVVAGNGSEALAAMDKQDFDLVFMDVQMPEMDGLEATAVIRGKEKITGKHQPIIALTAHAMKGDREKCSAGEWTVT
jgi:CheY-like chemotaxis protein